MSPVASILIYSENRRLVARCMVLLAAEHDVGQIHELSENARADVVILDTALLDDNRQLLEQIEAHPAHILLTGTRWPDDKQVDALLHAASGYYDLSEPEIMLHKAIQHILQGDIWVNRRLVPKVIRSLIASRRSDDPPAVQRHAAELLQSLSNRELDVAHMISIGESNKQIANALNISERTVKAHLTSIFKKLNVPDRLHLAILLKESS